MANSYATYTGNGTTTIFAVTFPYISQSEVAVTVSGQPVSFTWPTGASVQLGLAPGIGAAIKVYRTTAVVAQDVTFADGTTIRAADLNLAVQQLLYGLQDAQDNYAAGLAAALGNPTQLPGVNVGNNGSILGVAAGVWAVQTTAQLGFGAAAFVGLGTGPTQVPQNSNLGTAAYVNTGATAGQVPLNSNLGTAAYQPISAFQRLLAVNGTQSTGLTNITTATAFNVNYSLPANSLGTSKVIRIRAGGFITAAAAQSVAVSVACGPVSISSPNFAIANGHSGPFWIEMVLNCRAGGTSVSVGITGDSDLVDAQNATGMGAACGGQDQTGFNTTIANTISVSFASTVANNTAVLNTLLVEALN